MQLTSQLRLITASDVILRKMVTDITVIYAVIATQYIELVLVLAKLP